MRQGKNKRARGTKDGDADPYSNGPLDTIHSDSGYSRSHSSFHVSENYRAPPIPSRMPYTSDRESQPRSRRNDTDWRHADMETERYQYADPYSRDDRANYEEPIPRSSGGWRDIDHSTYGQSRNDWSRRYENGASSSSFPEPTTWGMVNPQPFEHGRPMYPERWEQNNPRSQTLDDWGTDVGRHDRRSDRRHHDWRADGHRDKNSTRKFQSDSGWDSRRRERLSWGSEHLSRQEDSSLLETHQHAIEERAWEPAASWKSSASIDNQQRGHNGQRSQPKHKRGQNHHKQRREWRTDDGELNNWTKRDSSRMTNKPPADHHPSRRKHPRSSSPSRSRSRSPTGSYKSFRSSRGRSRSRSFSPASKRRRRDSSRVTMRSRTPSERSSNRHTRFERYSTRSPSPTRSPTSIVERRRSPSAVSTTGSDRSMSQSPVGNGRSIHRLPSNHVISEAIPNISTTSTNNGFTSRKREGSRNGKAKIHQDRKVRDTQSQSEIGTSYNIPGRELHYPNAVPPIPPGDLQNMPMPPPASIPFIHNSIRHIVPEHIPPPNNRLPDKIDIAAKPMRTIGRNAGFKPIGKVNSSLKKFFPGDDDDMDFTPDELPLEAGTNVISATTLEPSTNEATQPRGWENAPPSQIFPVVSRHETFHEVHEEQHAKPCQQEETSFIPVDIALDRINTAPLTSHLIQDKVISGQRHRPSPLLSEPQKFPLQEKHEGQIFKAETHSSARPVAHKDLYKILTQVGEGTFGKVYKAQNTVTGTYVALKRIRMEAERDGFPVTAMREIKLLQSLRHSNVVRLYEMMVSNGSVYMVFEYMDHDLTGVLSQTQFKFLDEHLKSLCHQMLSGLAYLHHKGVIHRDIKGSNILINNRGELKLADFGLARFYQKRRRADYTNRVITLWYRPPELLFGATVYGPEVDMWSAGCIMLELFTKKPVFQGADEIHQLDVIFKLLGTPTIENWPDVVNLPWYELVKPHQAIPCKFREAFQKWMSPAALDLAQQLLAYDPTQRISAVQAIEAPYFTKEIPSPSPPVGLVDLEGEWHELETKRERAKRKERKTVT